MTAVAAAPPAPATRGDVVSSQRAIAWWPLGLVGIAALGLALGIVIIDAAPVGVFADDAFYVILARSLATGQGFRFLNLPGAPPATHFPPGYPLALALLWRAWPQFPDNVVLLKAFNALCLAVIGVATARYVRHRIGGVGVAIAVGLVTAASMPLLILGNMLLSELFFLALLMLLLLELEQLAEAPTSALRVAALGAAIATCTLVRTHGVVLIPATVAVLAIRRRWRDAAIVAAVSVLGLLPWQLWSARHGGTLPAPLLGQYDSYTRWWMHGYRSMGPSILTLTLRRTVDETLGIFAILFSPMRGQLAHAITLPLLGTVSIVGAHVYRRRMPVTLLFATGYLGVVLFWPGAPARFVWGVWPLFLILLAAGARALLYRGSMTRPRWRLASAAVLAWLVAGYGSYELRAFRGRWWSSIARSSTPRIAGAVIWTWRHTAPTDLVAADDDGAVYLYTGRHTVPVRSFTTAQYLTAQPSTADEGIVPILRAYDVRHVVVGTAGSYDAAVSLVAPPRHFLAPPQEFPGGAAFTVLPR